MKPEDSLNNAALLNQLFVQEEQKNERYANYARMLFTSLYFLVAFSVRPEIPAHSFNAIIIASLVNLVYGILIFFELRRKHPRRWVKYPSMGIDILLLSVVLYQFGTFRTFKSEAFLLYYLWIGLATLRFSPWLTLFAGGLSIGSFLLITYLAISNQTIELGSITEAFTTPKVSEHNLVLRIIFLSAFITLAVYVSGVFRSIATQALRKDLLTRQNIQLNQAMDRLRAAQKQLAAKNRELATLSEIDALTQLYNRRKIDQIMGECTKQASQQMQPLALALLDIDRFKSFNDQYGHQVGDKIIREVADLLRRNARGNDSIGRWGGEEFLVVSPDTGPEAAAALSERLRSAIETHDFLTGHRVTGSIGVANFRPGDDTETLLKRADEALYRSKATGRNRVTLA